MREMKRDSSPRMIEEPKCEETGKENKGDV
jgi:hypothetical protein